MVLGLDNCLLDNVVDRKPVNGRGEVLFAKSCQDSLQCKLSLRSQTSGCEWIVPIAVLASVLPSNGRPIVDLLNVIDGHLFPTPVVLRWP